MNKALLDTDIYSENPQGRESDRHRKRDHLSKSPGIPDLLGRHSYGSGQGFPEKPNHLPPNAFLAAIALEEILPLDQPAAELAGRIAGELERIGQPIGTADPMIAAIALHHGLVLVTGNTAHFQRVQQLGYPLILVNWRV